MTIIEKEFYESVIRLAREVKKSNEERKEKDLEERAVRALERIADILDYRLG